MLKSSNQIVIDLRLRAGKGLRHETDRLEGFDQWLDYSDHHRHFSWAVWKVARVYEEGICEVNGKLSCLLPEGGCSMKKTGE